jgi:hypothetical protein
MGMDSSWFTAFLDAYFESAAAELAIWRVAKDAPDGTRVIMNAPGMQTGPISRT